MQNLINLNSALENDWTFLEEGAEVAASGKIIVPLAVWLENTDALSQRGDIAVSLKGDDDPLLLKDSIGKLNLITVNFPAFADGRGYSLARLLRERLNFEGDVRAEGDVLIDQLYYMKRCGFSSFLLKEGLSAEKALNYFATFSDPYQLANDLQTPLFRRKA